MEDVNVPKSFCEQLGETTEPCGFEVPQLLSGVGGVTLSKAPELPT